MTIKKSQNPKYPEGKVVSFQMIIFLHLVPEGDLAWIVTIKNTQSQQKPYISLLCTYLDESFRYGHMALNIEMCIFIVELNLGLEIRK